MIDPSLPLVDLHRHLDGNVRLGTILELAEEHGIVLPAASEEELRPLVVIEERALDLMDFIGRFHYLTVALADLDACRRVAYENLLDARDEGLDYVELRFSPFFMAAAHDLDPAALTEAVLDGIRAGARDTGVQAQAIGILSRHLGVAACARELDALLAHRDGLVAVDLAGDEANFPAGWFREHFRRVRDAGLAVTVHAGEADGPASVWAALRELGAQRIGHGVRSVEDPQLLEHLAKTGVGLELGLTSNIHTGTVDDYATHPAAQLLSAGVTACLNTDDPAISGIDLRHEFEQAAPAAGLDAAAARSLQENALTMAFLSASERDALRRGKAVARDPTS